MILDFIRDNLDGKTWEKWCDDCYRDRYQQYNFVKIPSVHSGDAGIEGFTNNGIVYQCYCPEKNYSSDELYEHLRDKVTKDIAKLIDKENSKRLISLGVKIIREWHFVIPAYQDKRIVEHLEKKRAEIVAAREKDTKLYSYIHPDIQLVPKTAEDFKVELVRLIRSPLVDIKLNAVVKSLNHVDWRTCETDKIDNIKRKIKAIMGGDENNSDFKDVLQFWAEAYLKGIELMNMLQRSCVSLYEDLFYLEQQYKKDVSIRSKMNQDCSINSKLFNEIMDNFEERITREFQCFSAPSVIELKMDLVSGWLADCSLQFKVGD